MAISLNFPVDNLHNLSKVQNETRILDKKLTDIPNKDLFEAVKTNDEKSVDSLLAVKTDINVKDANGFTPIMYAIGESETAFDRLFNYDGVDLNATDDNMRTPIFHAIGKNDQYAFNKLVRNADVDLNARDLNGDTPLFYAMEKDNEYAFKVLSEQKDRIDLNAVNNNKLAVANAADKNHNSFYLNTLKANPNTDISVLEVADLVGNLNEQPLVVNLEA